MKAIKLLAHKILAHFGYRITKMSGGAYNLHNPRGLSLGDSMRSAMSRLKDIGIRPTLIFDIGAARGTWSLDALVFWPEANYVLIEPLREQISRMPQSLRSRKQISIFESVAGAVQGEINFNVSEDLDGSGIYNEKSENVRNVKVIAIDDLCKANGSHQSVLLKLDTHGYEIPIFKGAEKVLNLTSLVIVEVYGFYVSPTGKLFHEISQFLGEKGFRLFDIVDVTRRKKDGAFWQADAVYLRKDHEIFRDNDYR